MTIQALENATIRVIGATQVLNDPASLVKELVDNALDAHATSVAIEIHTNTLDVIQVRDNGHGIAPEDRSLVAIPNCTSKLVDIGDLKELGGTSLGFRGQALASAAELSDSLTISTRVEGEQVATALNFNQRGEVISQERASLPVGTTVRITDFVRAQPVRRQVALKNNEQCLKKIKQTLQAYAFARPHVRISLRVLKAKNEKGNWMYAPKPGGNVEDAALKIVGSACTSQCTWSVFEDRGFTLSAFVPRPDAEASKVSNIGAFVSVDARPVSASRGTLKQIVKIFRESLKAASSALDGTKEPFIYMRIDCPSASYDPNVEPAKDDVLFEDPDVLVDAARRLFAAVYPSKKSSKQGSQRPATSTSVETAMAERTPIRRPQLEDDEDDFVTSLEPPKNRRPTSLLDAREEEIEEHQLRTPILTSDACAPGNKVTDDTPVMRSPVFRSNMFGCDEEDLGLLDARPPTGRTEADFKELRQARNDISVSNPWVMAKMNSTLRRSVPADHEEGVEQDVGQDQAGSMHNPDSSPLKRRQSWEDIRAEGLLTPRPSSPSLPIEHFHLSDHVPDVRVARHGPLIGSQSLPAPQMHMPPPPTPHEDLDHDAHGHQLFRAPPAYDYTLASHPAVAPTGTPLHVIPDTSQRSRRSPWKPMQQGQINRPFVSPLADRSPREKVWFDHLEDEGRLRPKQKRPYQPRDSEGLVRQGELGDLVDDPRPLTPPRRNRDIRDFVGSVDLTGADSASSFIESRNYGQGNRGRSVGEETPLGSGVAHENASPSKGVLGARGFIPASELAAMEARFGPLNKNTVQAPPKRRKTGEGRALREISGNGTVTIEDGVVDGVRPVTSNRMASKRRRTTDDSTSKTHRTKPSRLPLERVPAGQRMHNVDIKIPTSVREISRWAGKVDEERSLVGWNEPALDTYDAFATMPNAIEVQSLAAKLHELLINRVSDGEMVQDLGVLVGDAFAAHVKEVEDANGM